MGKREFYTPSFFNFTRKNMKIFQTFTFILVANFLCAQSSDLVLKGVLDLDLPTQGFTGKATHLVATNNISDLSIYGLGTASNGGGSDSIELTLPAISVLSLIHI